MFTTSNEYKANQANLNREIFYEVEYGQIDTIARDTAVVSESSALLYFSKAEDVLNDHRSVPTELIGTLEPNQFLLDGNYNFTPEAKPAYEVGAWTTRMSDANGNTNVFYKIGASQKISAVALTIIFYELLNEYAVDFDITLKDGEATVLTKSIIGNTKAKYITDFKIENCNTVIITIKKWNKAYRYAKLTQVDFGVYYSIGIDNLTALNISNKTNGISENLPESTATFRFVNLGEYDPMQETGREKFITRYQPVVVKVGKLNEYFENHYETSGTPNVTKDEVEIKANSMISRLEKEQIKKWKNNVSLYNIAVEIFMECKIANYEIDESLKTISVTCLISENYRNTLNDLLIASCCNLIQRKNKVCIEKATRIPSGYLIKKDVSGFPNISFDDDIKAVRIVKKQFNLEANSTIETYTAENAGEHIVSIPASANVTIAGATLIVAGVDFVKFSAVAGAAVTISGQKIATVETVHDYGCGGFIKKIEGNPFIKNPDAIAAWILEYYRKRQRIETTWRQDSSIELLDVLAIESDYGDINILAEEQTMQFDGGMSGTTTGKVVINV